MDPIHLFALGRRHNTYLAARQTTIAGNIANVNTPGFKALDLEPFDFQMEKVRLSMSVSNPRHMAPEASSISQDASVVDSATWDTVHSGNSVSIEKELLKSGETKGKFSLNTSIMRSFHRMLLSAAKGGS